MQKMSYKQIRVHHVSMMVDDIFEMALLVADRCSTVSNRIRRSGELPHASRGTRFRRWAGMLEKDEAWDDSMR